MGHDMALVKIILVYKLGVVSGATVVRSHQGDRLRVSIISKVEKENETACAHE